MPSLTMLIAIYALLAVSTSLSLLEHYKPNEIIAAIIVGACWPVYITTKLIQRLAR
jgi:hypothetical protein